MLQDDADNADNDDNTEDDTEVSDVQDVPHALDVLNDDQLCAIVDLAHQNFTQWEPRDRMEAILKQAVQQTEEQFLG